MLFANFHFWRRKFDRNPEVSSPKESHFKVLFGFRIEFFVQNCLNVSKLNNHASEISALAWSFPHIWLWRIVALNVNVQVYVRRIQLHVCTYSIILRCTMVKTLTKCSIYGSSAFWFYLKRNDPKDTISKKGQIQKGTLNILSYLVFINYSYYTKYLLDYF